MKGAARVGVGTGVVGDVDDLEMAARAGNLDAAYDPRSEEMNFRAPVDALWGSSCAEGGTLCENFNTVCRMGVSDAAMD